MWRMSIYYRRFFCFHFKNHLLPLVYNSIPCWKIWVLQFLFLVHRCCFWELQAFQKHPWFVQNCPFIICIVYSNHLTRSWILIARCPDPAIKLFKFSVVTCCVFCDASGGVEEDKSFDKICCDLGVNFELAKSIAFCPAFRPALRAMFKAVSTTCFLLMNPDKKSLSFEKIPEPPTWYFLWYPRLHLYLM